MSRRRTTSVVSVSLWGLIDKIDEPNRSIIRRVVRGHRFLFEFAQGSRHKHQAWPGGYWDHLTEMMNRIYWNHVMVDLPMGRIDTLPRILRYSLSDALVVGFCHDAEKPFLQLPEAWPLPDVPMGSCSSKEDRRRIRRLILQHWGIQLDSQHLTAIDQAEGIRDHDYSAETQHMTPLGLAVHVADYWSAVYGQFPLASGDPFTGARRRVRTNQHRPA